MFEQSVGFAGKILWALIWLMIAGVVVIMFSPVALMLSRQHRKGEENGHPNQARQKAGSDQ